MNSIAYFVVLLACMASTPAPSAVGADPHASDPIQTAFEKLVRAATEADWRTEATARQELASLGQGAVPKLTESARCHGDARVRRACYEVLTIAFPKDDRAIDTYIRYGLSDKDAWVRKHCAFLLGDLKVQRAEPALRAALKGATGKDDELLRFTLSKSLAQLGQTDILHTLFAAVSGDRFMARHVGNIGLKALSGKNLEDFEEYHYAEGEFVSAGREVGSPFDAITAAEKKARRFQAVTAYFKWLKAEKPELYEYVTSRRGG